MPQSADTNYSPLFLPPQMPDPRLLPPGAGLPLQGLTILAVEDSRFASDAMRMMCQRSGARLRRTETLAAARAHLQVYRPDVVIVDLGLPDGRGEDLIGELSQQQPRIAAIFGTSGDPDGHDQALGAGANGFFDKPLEGLSRFQNAILRHIPGRSDVTYAHSPALPADPLALQDDLKRAAGLIAADPGATGRVYLAGFVASLAHSLGDEALARAARDSGSPQGLASLQQLISARLSQGGQTLNLLQG